MPNTNQAPTLPNDITGAGGALPSVVTGTGTVSALPDVGALPGKATLLPQFSSLGQTRPFGPGEYIRNPNGSWSSEISTTVADPRLNNGQPTVIPTLWIVNGIPTRLSEDQAVEAAIRSKLSWRGFSSQDLAEQFANQREAAWQKISPGDASVAPLWSLK